MRKTIKTLLYTLPLLVAGACDTTEDAYWVGPEPTDVLSVAESTILLNADGTAQDINISAICSWTASITENNNVFKISSTSGKGDGIISVSADPNYEGDVKTTSIEIQAVNFSKRVTVNVRQSSLTFQMDEKDYPVTPEEGGNVDLSFNSTTGWEFAVRANSSDANDVGSLDWLDFTPGYSGEGDFYETMVTATWKPNYTQQERKITLVLTPTNQNIMQYLTTTLPQPFTLIQEAGTLPTNVAGDTVSVGKTDISYRLQYESKSPVTECGVRVRNMGGELLMTAAADRSGDSYAQSGTANVSISGLDEGASYVLEPYVKNMVGETVGNAMEVRMKADVVYQGVRIVNYEVITTSRSVTARVTVESDIDVTEVGMSIFNEYYVEEPLVTYTQPTSGTSFTVDISSTDMFSPNSEAEMIIFARTSVNEARTERIAFKTKGQIPEEPDNNTPDVE